MLQVSGLVFRYAKNSERGAGPFSLHLKEGEIVGLLGPSGCGKTTILRVLAGLLPGNQNHSLTGTLTWNTERCLPDPQSFRVSMMFQQTVLLPHLNLVDNVLLPYLHNERMLKEHRALAIRLLSKLGLEAELDLRPEQLSGGMRTRTALARALITNPCLLLLDEPFIGIDIVVRERAYEVIEDFCNSGRTAAVIVSHDIEEAWRLCSRIIVLGPSGQLREFDVCSAAGFPTLREQVLSAMQGSSVYD